MFGYSQGEWNQWRFGALISVDFNSGNPVLLPNCPMNAGSHISATVADSLGNLLFYSHGGQIWDKSNNIMNNGTGLYGMYYAKQPVFVVPNIPFDSTYYLFTMGDTCHGTPFPFYCLYYSVVDMRLNSGLGGVVPGMKNILIPSASSTYSYLTGIRHWNNKDVWIVVKKRVPGQPYLSYLVNTSGISHAPVVSTSLLPMPVVAQCNESIIRISPDGTKLFCADTVGAEICNFNNQTGEITPLFVFTSQQGTEAPYFPECAEFSIDSRYLYVSGHSRNYPGITNMTAIFQYDASKTDSTEFMQSEVLLGYDCGPPQMASNWKIYIVAERLAANIDSFHVINYTSLQGISCGFQPNIFSFSGQYPFRSIPQFLQKYKAYIHYSGECQYNPTNFSGDIWPPADSIHWDFGDPGSGAANYSNFLNPSHLFSTPGSFTVEMWVRHMDKRTDTAWAVINIQPSPNPELGDDTTVCTGDSVTFNAGVYATCTYLWRNLLTGLPVGTNQTYTATVTGLYEVAVTDTNDCTGRDTVQFTVTPIPVVNNTPLSKTICSGESTNIVLTSNVTNVNFHWTASLTSGNITGFSADSGLVINQILVNHNISPGVVTYHITPKAGMCIGDTNDFTVTVNPGDSVDVSITASANNVCAGITVTFTATPVNGGTNPVFQWKVNGTNAGTNNPVFTYTPVNGDQVSCVLTSSNTTCITNNPATSDTIVMIVNSNLPVSVAITVSQNPVCAGTCVTFTAIPVNGGTSPVYQWKVNGLNVGTNNPVYSHTPVNNDVITCVLTSNVTCPTSNPAISNPVTMTVNPILPVSVYVAASQNPVCAGTSVTFTAIPVNGGTSPVYQWKVNGVNVGTNNPVYSYIPVNGDLVWCILTSSEQCTFGNPASSIQLLMVVNNNLPASVTVTGSPNPFCPGVTVSYTATPVNGGTSPVYQWKVNGNNAGTNSPNFSCSPQPGDSIWCVMTSNFSCVSGNPATSNKIIMVSSPVPVVTFTRCFDSITTLNAKPIKLKGGIPLGGTYTGPGVNSTTGVFTPSTAGTGTKTISYTYTNVALCSANKTMTIVVQSAPAFICGNNLTDIRDGKVYLTLQVGSQCWMAANLNYGNLVSSNSHQRDNCVPEKYCYQDLSANCNVQGANYQWDEIMRYDDTPGLQGLCPPAWHVPTEAEWNTLFANWTNNAFAGAPLKYSGYSGFNAILSGVRHLNVQWDYQNVATFFWSSTPYGAYKAWAHGMNDYDPSVAAYPALRSNAFSVRCLID